jgi:hypothetical protein
MPRLPFEGLDPSAKGSRFTWRPGLVVLAGEKSEATRATGHTAETSVRDVVGEWILESDADLGGAKGPRRRNWTRR